MGILGIFYNSKRLLGGGAKLLVQRAMQNSMMIRLQSVLAYGFLLLVLSSQSSHAQTLFKPDFKDMILFERVSAYGTSETYNMAIGLRKAMEDRRKSPFGLKHWYEENKKSNYPDHMEKWIGKRLWERTDVSVSIGFQHEKSPISGSVSLGLNPEELSVEKRRDLNIEILNLRRIFDSPSTPMDDRFIIAALFKDYLDIDISLTPEQMRQLNEGVALEYQFLADYIDEGLEKFSERVIDRVNDRAAEVIEVSLDGILNAEASLKKRMGQESGLIIDAFNKSNEIVIEELVSANGKLDSIQVEMAATTVQAAIAGATTAQEIETLKAEAGQCASNGNDKSRCVVLKNDQVVKSINQKAEFIATQEQRYTTRAGMTMARDLALLFGDEKTASHVNKAIGVYNSVNQISDISKRLATQSAMAAAGDVMSMMSLAISVTSMLSSGGMSGEKAMMEMLMQALKAIENMRKEMHARFDELGGKIDSHGLNLGLDLSIANRGISVLRDEVTEVKVIAMDTSRRLEELADRHIRGVLATVTIDQGQATSVVEAALPNSPLRDVFNRSLGTFVHSYFNINNLMDWRSLQASSNSSAWLSTPLAVSLLNHLNSSAGVGSANYGILDYLAAVSTEATCQQVHAQKLYIYNVLGEQVLRQLQSRHEGTLATKFEQSLLSTSADQENISTEVIKSHLPLVIKDVEAQKEVLAACLNNFYSRPQEESTQAAKTDKLNLVTYLLTLYQQEVAVQMAKLERVLYTDLIQTEMLKSVRAPKTSYLEPLVDKYTNIAANFPDRRGKIFLEQIDWKKSIDLQLPEFEKTFYEYYKQVTVCPGSQKWPKKHQRYPGWTLVNSETYPDITLPNELLAQVVPIVEARQALGMRAHEIEICYQPRMHYLNSSFVSNRKASRQTPSMMAFSLSVRSVGTGQNLERMFTVPIYIPVKDVKLSHARFMEHSQLILVKPLHHAVQWWATHKSPPKFGNFWQSKSYFSYIASKDLNSYLAQKLPQEKWVCPLGHKSERISHCYSEGFAPHKEVLKASNEGHIKSHFFRQENFPGVPKKDKRIDQWKSTGLVDALKAIQKSYLACYYRILLGYHQCEFGGQEMLLTANEKLDWSKAVRLAEVTRLAVEMFAVFKPEVTNEVRGQFIAKLQSALRTPGQRALELTPALRDQGIEAFLVAFEQQQALMADQLKGLESETQSLIQMDISPYADTQVHQGLKYYLERSQAL